MARIVWKRRNVLACVGVWVFLMAVAFYVFTVEVFCSDERTRLHIQELCDHYKKGKLTGDLCDALCTDGSLRFHKCIHVNSGKVVLRMLWNETYPVILKSEHASLHDFLNFNFQKISLKNPLTLPSPSILRENILSLVSSRFGKNELDIDAVKRWNIPSADGEFLLPKDATTLWLLFQQDEYVIMSYLDGHPGIPKLYGNCGHYYMTEFLPPGLYLHSGNFERKFFPPDWEVQTSIALQLIDLMQSFDEAFDVPLHFCDMKGNNFGYDASGGVKAIDLDMVAFDTYLQSRYDQLKCESDSDCEFFDCAGWCVREQSRCLPVRTNTNMKALCEKILLGGVKNFGFVGLLDNPPESLQSQLSESLNRCANPPVDSYKAEIMNLCSSVSRWSRQGHNVSQAAEVKCWRAVEDFQSFLVRESQKSRRKLKKLLGGIGL